MENKYEKKELLENLRIWNVATLNTMINEGVPLELFYIPNRTDILLETIVRKNKVLFKKILDKKFKIENNRFLYLHHAVRTEDWFFCQGILNNLSQPKEYVNLVDKLNNNNLLHTAISKKLSQKWLKDLSVHDVSWNTQNQYGHTPIHTLLRNYPIIENELVDELKDKKANFNIVDKLEISALDIINSFSLDSKWRDNNQYLINNIGPLNAK